MSFDAKTQRLTVLLVHHDAVVLEDLCETVAERIGENVLHRADRLSAKAFDGNSYDLALIEASCSNVRVFDEAAGPPHGAVRHVVWITGDKDRRPAASAPLSTLRQPFRTEDLTAALHASGVIGQGHGSAKD